MSYPKLTPIIAKGATEPRYLEDRFADVVNVKDFGAVNATNAEYTDTVLANNALAIQAAIDSAKINGGFVYIPGGVRYLRSGIDAAGVLVVDDSMGFRITSNDWQWKPVRRGEVKRILHRGLCAIYPENTVLAFEGAGVRGAWGIETDIQWTSDGYPVCMHDSTIDRTTDGTGTVQSKTLAQIRALDAGSWANSAFSTCLVPTFEEFLEVCLKYGMVPVIEIKTADNVTKQRVGELLSTLDAFGLTNSAFFTAFNWTYLSYVRELSKEAGVCGVKDGELTSDNVLYLQWLGGKVWYGPTIENLNSSDVSTLRNCGIDLYPWTATSRDLCDTAVSFGCDKILMNNFLI